MKKSIFIAAMLAAAAFCMTGCDKDTTVSSSKAQDTNSSYYSVNYTDTGDPESNLGNSKANVDHSSKSSAQSERSQAAESSEVVSSDVRRVSSRKPDSSSKGTTTKTTVTYYYTDEDGEHSTGTEVYITTDTDVSELQSAIESEVSSSKSESSENESSDIISQPEWTQGTFDESDLVFEYEGASIFYGANIEDITALLGEPLHIDSIPNAENPEFDKKTYNYEYFSIETVPIIDGTVYTVSAIQIFDDDIYTSKGVNIGMAAVDAVKIYGTDYMICDDEYRYYIGNRYMYLYVQNSVVANIGYGCDEDISTN